MLVLSRRIGESVIFDDAVTATVAVVGANFVDLSVATIGGAHLGRATLELQQHRPVVQGVIGVMVKRLAEDRVCLGFEVGEGISVARSAE
jgi:sRNA-binding carbon storage regulator CsrA